MHIHSIDPIATYILNIKQIFINIHKHKKSIPTKKKTQQLISQINASTPRVLLFTFN